MSALVNIKALAKTDYSLLELVKSWDDPRLVPYLLEQLDRISKQGDGEQLADYYTGSIMTTVAEKLGDEALKAFVKRFSGNEAEQFESYENDEYAENSEDTNETSDNAVEPSPEEEAAAMKAEDQRRSSELQHFVTLAMSTVPKPPTAGTPDPVASTEP